MPSFKFILIEKKTAVCPVCGKKAHYLCTYDINGTIYSSMSCCYVNKVKNIKKDLKDQYYESLVNKLNSHTPLNNWDKSIIRLHSFFDNPKFSIEWINQKIDENIKSRNSFIYRKISQSYNKNFAA